MEAANHASRWSISDVCLGAFAEVLLHDVSVLVGVADCASEGGWMNGPEVSILVHVLMLVSWLRHLAQRDGQSKRAILQSLRCCLPPAERPVKRRVMRRERLPIMATPWTYSGE